MDVLWPDEAYREVYAATRLRVLQAHSPLGHTREPHEWVSETTVPPWTIYVLGSAYVGNGRGGEWPG